MARFNSEETLWVVFPMILVIILLIAGIVFLPQTPADVRSRASEPKPSVITPNVKKPQAPEVVCTELYTPVCATLTHKTYGSPCEADLAGVTSFTAGACTKSQPSLRDTKPSPTPSSTPRPSNTLQYIIPSTN